MSEESIESLLLDGVESNALRGNGDNTQTLGNNLKDSDISEEFHKHYKGAGKEDLFWQAPDDSPFVAFLSGEMYPSGMLQGKVVFA